MEIFIALFGCLYLLYKFSADKAAGRSYKKKSEECDKKRAYYEKKYGAGWELQDKVESYILSGEHFDEICDYFAEDLLFVFGENWRDLLKIPPRRRSEDVCFRHAGDHSAWIYRLILADIGKMDDFEILMGFSIRFTRDTEMCYRFAQRIEDKLNAHGSDNIRFVRRVEAPFGREIQKLEMELHIEDLCAFGETKRMWGDDADTD